MMKGKVQEFWPVLARLICIQVMASVVSVVSAQNLLAKDQVDIASFQDTAWVNEKLEFGLTLPTDMESAVDLFIIKPDDPKALNPFVEWDIRVWAEVAAGQDTSHWEGFYFHDFQRVNDTGDIYRTPILANDEKQYAKYRGNQRGVEMYQDFGGSWMMKPTPYRFRVRIRTPKTNGLSVRFHMKYRDKTVTTNWYRMDVYDRGARGPLEVSQENPRYVARDGKTEFLTGPNGIGPNLHNALYQGHRSPQGHLYAANYNPHHLMPLMGFRRFEAYIDSVAAMGASMIRSQTYPFNSEIEYEVPGNYMHRLNRAWELDRMLERMEARGISWIMVAGMHSTFSTGLFGMYHYDWSVENNLPGGGNPWNRNGYNTVLGLENAHEFITSDLARKYFKQKLRYLAARYGYSTSLAWIEMFNELNQVGHAWEMKKQGDPEHCNGNHCLISHPPYSAHINGEYEGIHPQIGWTQEIQDEVRRGVGSWHHEMAAYLKDTVQYHGLLAPGLAGKPRELDNTWDSPHLDITAHTLYWSRKNLTNELPFYQFVENTFRKYQRPHFFSECSNIISGKIGLPQCDGGFEVRQEMWTMSTMGICGFSDWSSSVQPENYLQYGMIREWIEEINPANSEWKWLDISWPEKVMRFGDDKAICYAMKEGEERDSTLRLFGMIQTTTANFKTIAQQRGTTGMKGCTDDQVLTIRGAKEDQLAPEISDAFHPDYFTAFSLKGINKIELGYARRGKWVFYFFNPAAPDESPVEMTSKTKGKYVVLQYPTLHGRLDKPGYAPYWMFYGVHESLLGQDH